MVVKKIYGHNSGFFEPDPHGQGQAFGSRRVGGTPQKSSSDPDRSFDPPQKASSQKAEGRLCQKGRCG